MSSSDDDMMVTNNKLRGNTINHGTANGTREPASKRQSGTSTLVTSSNHKLGRDDINDRETTKAKPGHTLIQKSYSR